MKKPLKADNSILPKVDDKNDAQILFSKEDDNISVLEEVKNIQPIAKEAIKSEIKNTIPIKPVSLISKNEKKVSSFKMNINLPNIGMTTRADFLQIFSNN